MAGAWTPVSDKILTKHNANTQWIKLERGKNDYLFLCNAYLPDSSHIAYLRERERLADEISNYSMY